ncbi:uncharacterized protein ColSpa_03520 [Colletotrichum spaethianum]|uniref:BTB domain-containing protein n=1 Tax=Colletotrichum spaethianum TaxID=700344 RepID=A0AA37P7D5_9PEZI|nr:uncharacterized protein ColSpa_03520 [Colletotrichum spaethianum]GKT43339.1 hypothetical protein ColSpa_03520 [Colletotrichum spaethianum]
MAPTQAKHERAGSDPTETPLAKRPKPEPLEPQPAIEAQPVEIVVATKAEIANDTPPETIPTGHLLNAGRHLIPSDVIRTMRSAQPEAVSKIHVADEEPDIVGLMVRWCYRSKIPTVTAQMLSKPFALNLGERLLNVLPLPMPITDATEKHPAQYQTLAVYFDAYHSDGVQKTDSFEELRLCEYEKKAGAFGVYKGVVCSHAWDSNGQERQPDLDDIRKHLQDVEGIPMFGTGNARVEAELLQLKLVKLSMMAAKHGWVQLLDATLFAYAKGEINISRRCPVLRHIELAYSVASGLPRLRDFMAAYASVTTQTHNTRAELLALYPKCPGFLHDVMARQDAQTGLANPLVWYTTRYCPNGTERPRSI